MMTKKRFKPTISYDEWKARAERLPRLSFPICGTNYLIVLMP